jgi:hypothetical protein
MTGGRASVNDRFVECLVDVFHVGNVHRAHGFDGHTQRFISATVRSQRLSRGPQDPQNLSPIEPLALTMLAEAHSVRYLD